MSKLPQFAFCLLCCLALASSLNLKPKDARQISPVPFTSSDKKTMEQLPSPSQSVSVRGTTTNEVDDKMEYRVASEAVHGVATRLYSILDPRGLNNYLVSPLSVAAVVGQLLLGAKGTTQFRMRELLSPTRASEQTLDAAMFDQKLHQQLGGLLQQLQQVVQTDDNYYQLRSACAFFLQKDLQVYKSFFEKVQRFYGSDIFSINFSSDPIGSFKSINDWVSVNTGGLINQILSSPLPPSTAALLVNTIYFRADWLTPFSTLLTVDGNFSINATHQVPVRNMRGQFDIKFTESEELKCRMIILPYKQKDVNMYIILPNRDIGQDIKNFANQLTWRNISKLVKSSEEYITTVVLPKMKLKSTFSLKEPIMNYNGGSMKNQTGRGDSMMNQFRGKGPVLAVNQRLPPRKTPVNNNSTTGGKDKQKQQQANVNNFDLSGAAPNTNFKVQDILHQVSLEISERGTEAAAVSIGSVDYSGDIKSFKVDRPFVFFIRHEPSLVNLFWGVIMDPRAES